MRLYFGCCWPCKGSKNSANHNSVHVNKNIRYVVVDPVKVVKIQLITTFLLQNRKSDSCCWPCKGSKNSANHNKLANKILSYHVVVDPVKVVKIQLITTVRALVAWSFIVVVDPVKVVKIQLITTQALLNGGLFLLLLTL